MFWSDVIECFSIENRDISVPVSNDCMLSVFFRCPLFIRNLQYFQEEPQSFPFDRMSLMFSSEHRRWSSNRFSMGIRRNISDRNEIRTDIRTNGVSIFEPIITRTSQPTSVVCSFVCMKPTRIMCEVRAETCPNGDDTRFLRSGSSSSIRSGRKWLGWVWNTNNDLFRWSKWKTGQ